MTPRELVTRTLEFDSPPRIPRSKWVLPWAFIHYPDEVRRLQQDFPDDIVEAPDTCSRHVVPGAQSNGAGSSFSGCAYHHQQAGTFVDHWGCAFEIKEAGVCGEVKDPLIREWSDLGKVRAPEHFLLDDVEAVNAFCKATDKFVIAPPMIQEIPKPFERMQFLRGTADLYVDLMEQPPELFELLNLIHQYNIKILESWARTDVDAMFVMDDWGSQQSLLIPPDVWRTLLKPCYKDYIDIAHQHGKYIFFHSDGYIMEVLPDLIELGVDAINCQLFCMGVEDIGKRFGGKLTFWGEIDRQHILARGTSDEVVDAVQTVRQCLYQDGGVIAQCEFSAGGNPDNVRLVFETWERINREAVASV